jgi:hypothetical protein
MKDLKFSDQGVVVTRVVYRCGLGLMEMFCYVSSAFIAHISAAFRVPARQLGGFSRFVGE